MLLGFYAIAYWQTEVSAAEMLQLRKNMVSSRENGHTRTVFHPAELQVQITTGSAKLDSLLKGGVESCRHASPHSKILVAYAEAAPETEHSLAQPDL